MSFSEKVHGALLGVAIGDGMGAPVEGMTSKAIAEQFPYHDFHMFLPPTHAGDPAYGKGDGRITDDTLMTEALIYAYHDSGEHLDAYGYAKYMLPHMYKHRVFIPEKQDVLPIIERLAWPEKYPWLRIYINNAEPRTAGIGNCVNCGIAMYMMPIGAVNAAAPLSAYAEAAAFGAAHNESFALEAAAVTASAYAAAFGEGGNIDAVVNTGVSCAQDGTRKSIEAALNAVSIQDALPEFIRKLRLAMAVFDPHEMHSTEEDERFWPKMDENRPSRAHAIEELPVALASLLYGQGDFVRTIEACVRYGRDCDSIACIACGLLGALAGGAVFPGELVQASEHVNRRDYRGLADMLTSTCRKILTQDSTRMEKRANSILAGISWQGHGL